MRKLHQRQKSKEFLTTSPRKASEKITKWMKFRELGLLPSKTFDKVPYL
jgi:hypothetical protein